LSAAEDLSRADGRRSPPGSREHGIRLRRKLAEKDEKRPEAGPSSRSSWLGRFASNGRGPRAFGPDERAKENVPPGCLGGGRRAVAEPSQWGISTT
jgi:hypothetical protein